MISFGTDGWRAVVADTFTFGNLKIVTQAIANYIKSRMQDAGSGMRRIQGERHPASSIQHPALVVGYDNRFMAEDFARAVAGVLAANKIKTFLAERPAPTPAVAFAVKSLRSDGAIMLTASHNPFYYNGIKFIPDYAGPATEDITSQIEKEINRVSQNKKVYSLSGREIEGSSLIEQTNIEKDYLDSLKKLLDIKALKSSSLKVVVDPLYGAAGNLMIALCKEAGLRAEAIHAFRDPLFGGSLPDPSSDNLKELKKVVLSKKADLGLALDGDGDRIGVIADDSSFVSANTALSLLLIHLKEYHKAEGVAVRTVATTHLVDAIARDYGVEVVETPVGFKYIGQLMLKRKVIVGGEESGGSSIGGHIPEKDGLLANLLLCEMVAVRGRKLSSILKDVAKKYGRYESIRLDIPISSKEKEHLLANLKSKSVAKIGQWRVDEKLTVDGVKFLLEGGRWLLIRPSGTEPLIRAYLETHSEPDLTKLKRATTDLIKEFSR